jgi:hypothetical protein
MAGLNASSIHQSYFSEDTCFSTQYYVTNNKKVHKIKKWYHPALCMVATIIQGRGEDNHYWFDIDWCYNW